MKRRSFITSIASLVFAVMITLSPLYVFADDNDVPEADPAVLAPILITEVQTGQSGSGNASKEFIELYNTTDQAIDLTAWQLWYVSATADSFDAPTKRISFAAGNGQPLEIAPQAYFVLSGNPTYLYEQRDTLFDATLAANGHLRLIRQAEDYATTCQLIAEDAVSWGTAVPPAGAASPAPAPGESIGRMVTAAGQYIDTNAGSDFKVAATPTPRGKNTATASVPSLAHQPLALTDPACTVAQEEPDETSITTPGDSPPSVTEPSEEPGDPQESSAQEPVIPARNSRLASPQVSELLPNPASPQTDAQDEFVELYNPNTAPFDLSGYSIEMGATTKRRYTIPKDTLIQPHAFMAFFSGDTSISLSNTQGQVRLLDPFGRVLSESSMYESAKDGQAWLLANGIWQWTTKPTPNSLNVVSVPPAGKKKADAKVKTASATATSASKGSGASKDNTEKDAAQTVATATTRAPIHGGVLALIGGFALLYGAYEYRRDVANKIHQFRSNRAARRELRQDAKGR